MAIATPSRVNISIVVYTPTFYFSNSEATPSRSDITVRIFKPGLLLQTATPETIYLTCKIVPPAPRTLPRVVSNYSVELRNKNGNLKAHITPFVNNISWEWNRIGGCGRCSITIHKKYREVIFDARDDIQIRVKYGDTTKLVYRGYIANIIPTLKIDQDVVLDVRGYFDLLKKLVVHTDGDKRTYTSDTVANIADDIIDTFVTPNTPITLSAALTDGSFEIDTISFLCTVENALDTLAQLQGDIEYGVDEDLVFFWETESSTINHQFFIGNNVKMLERRVSWDNLVNKVYLIGGELNATTTYKVSAENTDSQALYYLSEDIVNNSSITTASVANQYIGAILSEKANPQFDIRAEIVNTPLRIEDTIPMGLVSFYDATYDKTSLGDLIGDIIGELADSGSDITIGLLTDTAGSLGALELTSGGSGYVNGTTVLSIIQDGASGGTVAATVAGGVITYIGAIVSTGENYRIAANLLATDANGDDALVNITALASTQAGDDIYVGGEFSSQVNRISYKLSNTPGRFNMEVQLGDTILETAAKIKRLEMALSNLNQGV